MLLSVGHLGALVVSAVLAISMPLFGLLCAAVAVSWCTAVRRHAMLRSGRSIVALVLEGEQSCAVRTRNGLWVHGTIKASSYVLPCLIVLDVAIDQRMFGMHIMLLPDSVTAESHRRLRMRLRWLHYDADGKNSGDAPL